VRILEKIFLYRKSPTTKKPDHQGPVFVSSTIPLQNFPLLSAYSLLSDKAPTTTVLPCAFLLTLAATDSVDHRTLLRAARRSLLVDLTTLADH
jgi:hypothetical protein